MQKTQNRGQIRIRERREKKWAKDWWSYCPSRVYICHTENLFKWILRGFAYNRGPRKHYIRIRTMNVFIKIKNPSGIWFTFTAIFIGGIQGLKAYNSFKTILQSKPAKHSTSMGLVWVRKNLAKKNYDSNIMLKIYLWIRFYFVHYEIRAKKLTIFLTGKLSKTPLRTGSGFSISYGNLPWTKLLNTK